MFIIPCIILWMQTPFNRPIEKFSIDQLRPNFTLKRTRIAVPVRHANSQDGLSLPLPSSAPPASNSNNEPPPPQQQQQQAQVKVKSNGGSGSAFKPAVGGNSSRGGLGNLRTGSITGDGGLSANGSGGCGGSGKAVAGRPSVGTGNSLGAHSGSGGGGGLGSPSEMRVMADGSILFTQTEKVIPVTLVR